MLSIFNLSLCVMQWKLKENLFKLSLITLFPNKWSYKWGKIAFNQIFFFLVQQPYCEREMKTSECGVVCIKLNWVLITLCNFSLEYDCCIKNTFKKFWNFFMEFLIGPLVVKKIIRKKNYSVEDFLMFWEKSIRGYKA